MKVWWKKTARDRKSGKTIPKGTPGAKRETVESRKWYGTLRTADGKRRQVPLMGE